MIRNYRKKLVVIQAVLYPFGMKHDADVVREFVGRADLFHDPIDNSLTIPTLEGDHKAMPGDFIIRGVKGEFYPCKPDIFAATYHEVDDEYFTCVGETPPNS